MDTTINVSKLEELMQDYAEAETATERRKIENAVLKETVWQIQAGPNHLVSFTREEYDRLAEAVDPGDDQQLAMLVRRPYFDDL